VVELGHIAKTAAAPDLFVRKVAFRGDLDEDQQARLLEIAERCPVHRTLTESASVETQRLEGEMSDEGAPDNPEDHVRQMEETCAAADRAKSPT
jgi:putative redox protein